MLIYKDILTRREAQSERKGEKSSVTNGKPVRCRKRERKGDTESKCSRRRERETEREERAIRGGNSGDKETECSGERRGGKIGA